MFYVFTAVYILLYYIAFVEWKWWMYCSKKPGQAICFFLVCVFICESQQFPFYRLSGSIFLPAINCFCTVQKKRCIPQTTPFFQIALHKALYGILTAQSSFFIPLPWFQLHTFIWQNNIVSWHIIFSHSSPVLSLSRILSF